MGEVPTTTHTYVSRVWYRDTATLFNIASFVFLLLQDQTFLAGLSDYWRHMIDKIIVAVNLWIRFQSSTRPVAMSSGQTREVFPIPIKENHNSSPLIVPAILLFGLLSSSLVGCAQLSGRHVATVTVVSAHAVLSAIQDTERAIVCGGPTAPAPPACVPAEAHRAIARDLATAFDYDGQVAQLVRAAPEGVPANVAELVGKIAAIVDRVIAALPSSSAKQALVQRIGGK